ncbi:hypothetical protein BRC88_11030 [Halobacteriales archaeon QS_4_69_225]|nr:MAG: hypothetical protein BRC88_11030 [Halobacteriales archaeon QS_4_69_225]
MSDEPIDDSDSTLPRRTFMKAAGATAGAAALGVGAGSAAAAVDGLDSRLLNWRRVEAKKAWDRGYRGRPDRTLAITDSGLSARHPDLGPWNGVVASTDDDGNLVLADVDDQNVDYPDPDAAVTVTELATLEGSGSVGPGAADAGQVSRDVIVTFTPATRADQEAAEEDQDLEPTQLEGTLTWTPQRQDNELFLEKKVDGDWEVVRSGTDFNPLSGAGERIVANGIEAGAMYRWVIETYVNASASYEFTGAVNNRQGVQQPDIEFGSTGSVDPFEEIDYEPGQEAVDPAAPKTVGWYNEAKRYTEARRPRDGDGHGSHCAGIMSGTGQASVIDYRNTTYEEPRTVVLPTEFLEYDVEVAADATVFASAIGDNVRVEVIYDDEVVHSTGVRTDSIIADEPAVHGSGTATYTIRVRPYETDAATGEVAERAQEGNPTAGRLTEIAYGSYVAPGDIDGSPPAGARRPGGNQSVHPGIAPNFSLVGLEGLAEPTLDLGEFAGAFADVFNVRAVNMSWGYIFGLPIGATGGALSDIPSAIRKIAEGGMLSVAAAGNAMTPANGNGAPAGMDEAISVAATDPFDGLTPYSAGGLGTADEDENDVDRKPDVTAPGGDINDYAALLATALADGSVPVDVGYPIPGNYELARAVQTGDENTAYEAADPPRDYTGKGGTSMASPYTCGTVGLVAQAMEEDAPDSIALPAPGDTEFDDVMRLKQVVLATASETVFTAAPYHAAKSPPSAPQYTHGERDPYEGFGRVNPDAAVDAVSRNLLGANPQLGDETYEVGLGGTVGTNLPVDSRAVAGYVDVPGGSLDVSVDFTSYAGGNAGQATGSPHLDLFVYDAANPDENGEPSVVASARGTDGTASVSVDVDRGSREDPNERTFYVVAKIVNIPGAVNGYDVQANFEMSVNFDPADAFPPKEIDLDVSGSRDDDASVFTAGQTNRVEITVDDFNEELTDAVRVTDQVPDGWSVDENFGDVDSFDENSGVVTFEGTASADDVSGDGSKTFAYFAEAPEEGADDTGTYTFGPAEATAVNPETFDDPNRTQGSTSEEFGGTDTNTVVGASTNA